MRDGDAGLDESSGQFEIDTASTFVDNSSKMTETFDKAAGSPDHTVQFELSNYTDKSCNSGAVRDVSKSASVSVQFHNKRGGASPSSCGGVGGSGTLFTIPR